MKDKKTKLSFDQVGANSKIEKKMLAKIFGGTCRCSPNCLGGGGGGTDRDPRQ